MKYTCILLCINPIPKVHVHSKPEKAFFKIFYEDFPKSQTRRGLPIVWLRDWFIY